ncbi:hypothetical protein RSOLAG1IB_05523 [Rhizoctonia solani AG-1 IB]|uniref:Uncharacterized protein n=1 Tax=Thanatephorus cucumeris (strain AG1-IB / isolate 7/3/14) TaxID=1108050 RepID=A0A0B7G0K9_THACB|nr:hypothetical protein RSOLAG1IB_05523 [Rhizoctonia solani AG-1 IB]
MMASCNFGDDLAGGCVSSAIDYEMGRLLSRLSLLPQEPGWRYAGSMQPIYSLVETLSKLSIAPKIYGAFTRNKFPSEASEIAEKLPCGVAAHPSGTVQHIRGSSKTVYATPNTHTENIYLRTTAFLHLGGNSLRDTLDFWMVSTNTQMNECSLAFGSPQSIAEIPIGVSSYDRTSVAGCSLRRCTCFTHDL